MYWFEHIKCGSVYCMVISYIICAFLHADLYTIEFQKRGLPHSHTLIWESSRQIMDMWSPKIKDFFSRFEAHINVEYYGWSMMIKYLFKYISKGVDRVRYAIEKSEPNDEASLSIDTNKGPTTTDKNGRCINEVQNFLDGRYICPPENNSIKEVLSNPYASKKTLLAWFENNVKDPAGRELTFTNYRKSYRWDVPSKSWDRRVDESSKMVGWLVFVHPSSGELFYLRMLLFHQKG
uniref:Helitron helicase-like domain-containing protein n=1 Tax=Lactuca sativa TaxID=4236 RepID=A0A9R1W9X6_LACSA|nr:hypothetical protein LSAT_V11C200061200 [Lactuca sativa]